MVSLDDKFIGYAIEGGILKLPTASVAVLDLLGWWQEPDEIAGQPEGVMMRKGGDFHGTEIKGINAEGKVETFSPLFGKRTYDQTELRALEIRRAGGQARQDQKSARAAGTGTSAPTPSSRRANA